MFGGMLGGTLDFSDNFCVWGQFANSSEFSAEKQHITNYVCRRPDPCPILYSQHPWIIRLPQQKRYVNHQTIASAAE